MGQPLWEMEARLGLDRPLPTLSASELFLVETTGAYMFCGFRKAKGQPDTKKSVGKMNWSKATPGPASAQV